MPHALRAAVLVCLLVSAPASAVTLAFGFAGTVSEEDFRDDLDALDARVDPSPGNPVSVTGTYQVDLIESSPGGPIVAGAAQLSFQLGGSLGHYSFDVSEDPHSIALINDRVVLSTTIDLWQSHELTAADLAPATANHGTDFAGFAAQIEFNDFSATVFDGTETDAFVPDTTTGWDQVLIRLTRLSNAGGPPIIDSRVQVQMNLTDWHPVPVPEVRSGALLAFGLVPLGLRARRRVRVR
jgi:hypothetical protein